MGEGVGEPGADVDAQEGDGRQGIRPDYNDTPGRCHEVSGDVAGPDINQATLLPSSAEIQQPKPGKPSNFPFVNDITLAMPAATPMADVKMTPPNPDVNLDPLGPRTIPPAKLDVMEADIPGHREGDQVTTIALEEGGLMPPTPHSTTDVKSQGGTDAADVGDVHEGGGQLVVGTEGGLGTTSKDTTGGGLMPGGSLDQAGGGSNVPT